MVWIKDTLVQTRIDLMSVNILCNAMHILGPDQLSLYSTGAITQQCYKAR